MTENPNAVDARLDALAAVDALVRGDLDGADHLVRASTDPWELASAAVGLAGSVLLLVDPDTRERVVAGLRAAARE
ncbi:hypothetical protein [Intrasporangium sp. DVR]|uniref:hypothetical protein n=1 Tax=Intrasporangium sp. DVR TaxID=3127867 RepID=UPI00313A6242